MVKLILIDCEMPVMDGYQATKLIREHERELGLPRCLIVGVSGNSGDQYEKKCRANGMDQLITKPVNINQLKKFVEQAMLL
jgi:two-component system sensor histidine kinase EvgS